MFTAGLWFGLGFGVGFSLTMILFGFAASLVINSFFDLQD